jgi:predicted flavoprotein YhiN
MQTRANVTDILMDKGRVIGVRGPKTYPAAAVILAAGGATYPGTGSAGDGYRLAAAVGHTVTRLRPSLVPLVVHEIEHAKSMQGVSLHNVRLTSYQCPADEITLLMTPARDTGRGIMGKRPRFPVIESRTGDMIITHFGLGGPIILQMSLAIVDALEHGPVSVSIDLTPSLDVKTLRERLQRDFNHYSQRSYYNILKEFLPQKMVEPFVEMTVITSDKRGHEIVSEERERLVSLLKSLRFNIKASLPMAAAMVTAGGVSLKEINPRTMASNLVDGLYFCGEIMDIDAETGGYNLQAAFSTGYVAGENAAALAHGVPS